MGVSRSRVADRAVALPSAGPRPASARSQTPVRHGLRCREADAEPLSRRQRSSVGERRELGRRRNSNAAAATFHVLSGLTAPVRRRSRLLAPATSRMSDDAALGSSLSARSARPNSASRLSRGSTGQAAGPAVSTKSLLIDTSRDGRGWFRTTVLSRVKHGVRGRSERRNTCKSNQILALAGARRWAWYGPIWLALAQRMAQPPPPPRRREMMRCAGDDRDRHGCASAPCFPVSQCLDDALDGSCGRRVVAGA
jgi:hypothetical protein